MAGEVASLGALHPDGYPGIDVVGDTVSLRFFIPGKPVPKGRPRARTVQPKDGRSAWVSMYTDGATVGWESHIGWTVKEQLTAISIESDTHEVRLPFDDRVLVALRFNFEKPKSTPKRVDYPVKSRTDVDNLAKAVLDALQNVSVIRNDNIVTDLVAVKRFAGPGHPQGVEIDITALGAQ